MQARYEGLKALLTKHSLDKQLGNSIKEDFFKTGLATIIHTSDELEDKASFWECTRITSAPFLIFVICIVIGLIISYLFNAPTIADFLGCSALIAWFIWGIFLYQGGFNLIFKRMMLLDLLKRYDIK